MPTAVKAGTITSADGQRHARGMVDDQTTCERGLATEFLCDGRSDPLFAESVEYAATNALFPPP